MSFSSHAQFHLGAKAGANLTKLDGQSFNDKFELGYQLGGFVYYNLNDFLGLQMEVFFNQTNTEIADSYSDIIDQSFENDKKLNYVSVPLLLRLNTDGLLTISAGPQFSFMMNENVLNNGKKLFKDSDFAAIVGAELNLFPIIIYGRYTWGFADISDFGGDVKSQQIQLGVAFRFF
ncbi:porin family protein [Galbibacter pacificus]|uniref:Porin family protein n=1 Tax=Galbibacter pacificus TaxID=2996052 RepID=A0ABT6FQY2_9FLAO|nr:porin family protein [Galbibacter pacificus]MDG3581848.1 porin family protein [Galbibacter pacificus]MDG3585678.1 porin family protein [Galbibacter pacificus]